jgi:positive regulator of sigma E activity
MLVSYHSPRENLRPNNNNNNQVTTTISNALSDVGLHTFENHVLHLLYPLEQSLVAVVYYMTPLLVLLATKANRGNIGTTWKLNLPTRLVTSTVNWVFHHSIILRKSYRSIQLQNVLLRLTMPSAHSLYTDLALPR